MLTDICASRDDAQPHIFRNGRCVLCLKSAEKSPNPPADPRIASVVNRHSRHTTRRAAK